MQSNMSSYVHDTDSARSVARVYEPSVRERARTALEGRWGVCLELTNFALSVLIFSMYIAEVGASARSGCRLYCVIDAVDTCYHS